MSYQAVIRNGSDQLVANHAVGMRISILQGSEIGTPIYVETQTPTTNTNGLATIEIGGGTPVTGIFASIDWSTGTYFIKTETDPTGGTSYTITGTSQLLSVPYALYAKTVANYNETDPIFGASPAHGISSTSINNWNTSYFWGNHADAGYAQVDHTHNTNHITSGIFNVNRGGTGYNSYTSGQLLIGNISGTLTKTSLTGTVNQINVTNGDGSITLSTTQDIHTGASPTFVGMTVTDLTPNRGVYTDGTSRLTSTSPTTGTLGYWDRISATSTLSPSTSGDAITTSGNIYTTGTGTVTSAGLLTGSSGATVKDGEINLNKNSNFVTYINTGTSTGDVVIGNSLNTIILPKFNTSGVFHNDVDGQLMSGLILNNDIGNGTIDLTTKVTGVLLGDNGGTGVNNGTMTITLVLQTI
jgi:hypothetical protein